MAVLKRLAGFALLTGAMGGLLAPATPAAERGAGGSDDTPASASSPQGGSSVADDPVVSADEDAVPSPDGGAGAQGPSGQGGRVVARAAASTTVTISDFKFAPKSITVNVGDTVTWTNEGPRAHTATATDRSFDTRLLQRGETGSATFDKAGTYPYICTPHPTMKGTVKVVAKGSSSDAGGGDDDAVGGGSSGAEGSSGANAASGSGAESGSGGANNAGGGSGDASGDDPELANTGTDSLLVGGTGLGLLLCGLGLRLLPRRA